MSIRFIAIAGAGVLLLSAGIVGVTRTEAGPPDHYADLSVEQVETARIAAPGSGGQA